MKKQKLFPALIVSFFMIFLFSSTALALQCNIEWWGTASGSVPTDETSKTEAAIYQAFTAIWGEEPANCSAASCVNANGNLGVVYISGVVSLWGDDLDMESHSGDWDVTCGCDDHADCDDGKCSNGREACLNGSCSGLVVNPTCIEGVCDETSEQCVECLDDGGCDDGIYCNGAETCESGDCAAGPAVDCTEGVCDETSEQCVECVNDGNCTEGYYCDETNVCISCILGESLDAPDAIWNTSGDADWSCVSDASYFGDTATRSGLITHNETTALSTTVVGPATISFYYQISSDFDADNFRFTRSSMSGWAYTVRGGLPYYSSSEWDFYKHDIPKGTHTLKWEYSKDSSISRGADCVWIDQVIITPKTCVADTDCNDILYCNGEETCVDYECVAGTAVDCGNEFCDEAGGGDGHVRNACQVHIVTLLMVCSVTVLRPAMLVSAFQEHLCIVQKVFVMKKQMASVLRCAAMELFGPVKNVMTAIQLMVTGVPPTACWKHRKA